MKRIKNINDMENEKNYISANEYLVYAQRTVEELNRAYGETPDETYVKMIERQDNESHEVKRVEYAKVVDEFRLLKDCEQNDTKTIYFSIKNVVSYDWLDPKKCRARFDGHKVKRFEIYPSAFFICREFIIPEGKHDKCVYDKFGTFKSIISGTGTVVSYTLITKEEYMTAFNALINED